MKMRWPAQYTMPQLLYSVSKLAPQINHATFAEAMKVLKLMKQEAEEGHTRVLYKKNPEKDMVVATFFYASLGKEDQGKSQLGAMHFVANQRLTEGPAQACLVDFTSTKSTRVVRSSMAGEAAWRRSGCSRLGTNGGPTGPGGMEGSASDPGFMITNAKNMFDHLISSGQINTERQTLDLLKRKTRGRASEEPNSSATKTG